MTKGDKMMKNIAKICAVCGIMVLFSACGNEGDFDAMGIFEADEVLVSAEVSGKITEFSALEGANLMQGDIAVKIDSTQIALNKEKLELQLQNASAESTRLKRLYKANAGKKKDYDNALLQEMVLSKELEILRDTLEKTQILAPINGVVMEKYALVGELATPAKPLFKIANIETLRLKAYFTNADISKIALGDKVRVFVDFDKDLAEYEGKIVWISPKAEFTPKTIMTKDERENLVYAVKIEVANKSQNGKNLIKIGSYGQVKLR